MTDFEDSSEEEYKSKTQIKNELHELQALGAALLDVPMGVYRDMPIPEELDEALTEARRINSNIAKKRQLQYIGKVMRQIDVEPIKLAYEDWKNGRKKLAQQHHQLEHLRDQLIEGDNALVTKLVNEHPECDIQLLRQLIRLAQQEKEKNKPPKNYRKLFQFLRDLKGL